jgi:hypothetical protein
MKSKKILSIAIAAAVVFNTTATVFATSEDRTKLMEAAGESQVALNPVIEQQAKITKDEAKKIAKTKLKEYLDQDLDESKFQVRIDFRPSYYNQKDDYVWEINWNANQALKSTNFRVSLNANTGKVISIGRSVYSQFEPQPTVPSITQEKAKEVAETFMNKVFTNELPELKLIDDSMTRYMNGGYQPVNYSFNYQRYKNNVLLEGDFVRVEVDGINGIVMNFDSKLSENVELPSAEGILSKDKAEQILKNQTELSLMYLPYRSKYEYESPQSNIIKLVYNIGEKVYSMLDAKTGTIMNNAGSTDLPIETKNLTAEERAEWIKKAGELKAGTVEIDSTRAEQVIIDKLKELYGEAFKVEYLSYEENKENYELGGRKAWRANFYKEVDGKRLEEGGSISIDALTEGIISVYKYDGGYRYDEEFTPKLTWSEAYNKAIEAIAKYFPDKIKDVNTEQRNTIYKQIVNGKQIPQREYYFNFQRTANGIIYRNDSLNVTFDAKTGNLREIRSMWTDKIKFPSANGTMSTEEAKNILFEKYKPELTYALIQTPESSGKFSTEYKLVYRLKPVNVIYSGEYIDAFNGKLVNYDGQEVVEQSSEFFNKIKGHKFEKELTILAFQGIVNTNNFELDKPVTSLDFIRMLVDAKGYRPYLLKEAASLKYSNVAADNANYSYLQMGVFYGILENKEGEFDFNQNVTREAMAKTLVKMLGYDNLAKDTDIFVLPVSDSNEVKSDQIGYIAIAKALKILEVENNKIRSAEDTTMVELAMAIYRILGNLRSGVYY